MTKPLCRAAVLAVAFLVLGTLAAFAQAVDVRPAVNSALEWTATLLTAVLTVLGGLAIRFVSAKTGLTNSELEASLNARLDAIIHSAINAAYLYAQNEVNKPGSGLEAVKFDNWFMSLAASYVVKSAPEIIAKFQLSQARIEEMITARLPAYIGSIPVAGGLPSPVATISPPAPIVAAKSV